MSCGIVVPVYRELLEEVTLDMLAWRRGDPEGLVANSEKVAREARTGSVFTLH